MKKILIILSVLFLIGITQVNAQCCKPVTGKAQNENVKKQDGKTVKLRINGMTCAGCDNFISTALKELDGIIEYPGDLAVIQYDPKKTKPKAIITVIENKGYKAEIIKETQKIKNS